MIPLYVTVLSKLIPILKSSEEKAGEIKKFNFVESQKNQHRFRDRVNGCEDGYDYIAEHISDDYFKIIGKWKESVWTGQ